MVFSVTCRDSTKAFLTFSFIWTRALIAFFMTKQWNLATVCSCKCSELGRTCIYEGHEPWYFVIAKFKVGCVWIRLLCGCKGNGDALIGCSAFGSVLYIFWKSEELHGVEACLRTYTFARVQWFINFYGTRSFISTFPSTLPWVLALASWV
jgi:hypothetical protein